MGFTKGPINKSSYGHLEDISGASIPVSGVSLPCGSYHKTAEDNRDLLMNTINAATAVEEMGYDGIEAIKALPGMTKALESIAKADRREQWNDDNARWADIARAVLSKAKGENNAPV